MAGRMRMAGNQSVFEGGEEEKKGKIAKVANWIDPIHGIGKAASYISDPMNIQIREKEGAATALHVFGNSGSYYDSGSSYRQVVSRPQVVGMSIDLPPGKTWFSELAPGDKLNIAGNDWTIVEMVGSKGARITDGTDTIEAISGQRLSNNSQDPYYNCKIFVGQAESVYDAAIGKNGGAMERMWIVNEDSLIGKKFAAGDKIKMPFGVILTYDGLVNNETSQITFAIESGREFKISATETISNEDAIKVSGRGMEAIYYQIPGQAIHGDTSYFIPGRNLFLVKGAGDNYFRALSTSGLSSLTLQPYGNSDYTKATYIQVKDGSSDLHVTQLVREGVGNNKTEESVLKPIWMGTGRFQFKQKDTDIAHIFHRFLLETVPSAYELPVWNSRGSSWTSISTTDATLQSSNEIAKAQWSVSTEGTTGISGWKVTPKEFSIGQNHPNPFGAEGTIVPVTISKETNLSVKVFDAIGREVKTIENGANYQPGKHEFGIDLQGLPSGIYFCKVATAEGTQSVKMNYKQ